MEVVLPGDKGCGWVKGGITEEEGDTRPVSWRLTWSLQTSMLEKLLWAEGL